MKAKYWEITESPTQKATKEQLERLYHRYHFATGYIKGGVVLEVACGTGLGLGYLAQHADKVVGGDIDEVNVEAAQKQYEGNDRVEVMKLDAHCLPFPDESFDAVLLYEAIYYLEDPKRFISDSYRVLKEGGYLLIGTVNKAWRDFHPSKYSLEYFTAGELIDLLNEKFSSVRTYGAFIVDASDFRSKMIMACKRCASRFNLIPGTLQAREYLKRVFFGPLEQIPSEIEYGLTDYEEPFLINEDSDNDRFKIVYAVARK